MRRSAVSIISRSRLWRSHATVVKSTHHVLERKSLSHLSHSPAPSAGRFCPAALELCPFGPSSWRGRPPSASPDSAKESAYEVERLFLGRVRAHRCRKGNI